MFSRHGLYSVPRGTTREDALSNTSLTSINCLGLATALVVATFDVVEGALLYVRIMIIIIADLKIACHIECEMTTRCSVKAWPPNVLK